jgi:acyl-CoA hydrolase
MAKFLKPVTIGDCLTFSYKIVHTSNSSMTIRVDVESKNFGVIVFTGYITFVAVKDGKPTELNHKCLVLNPNDDDYKFVERFRKFLKGKDK